MATAVRTGFKDLSAAMLLISWHLFPPLLLLTSSLLLLPSSTFIENFYLEILYLVFIIEAPLTT